MQPIITPNVALVNSPLFREAQDTNDDYLPPLGLAYIATSLEKAHIPVTLFDSVANNAGIAEIQGFLQDLKADIVGINIFTQNQEIVREIMERTPNVKTWILGGQWTNSGYKQVFSWNVSSSVWVILGEGEKIIPALAQGTRPKSECIKKRKNVTVWKVSSASEYFPSNLDENPLNRGYLAQETNTNHFGNSEASIITSRGCPFDCGFCCGARSVNPDVTIRKRSTESLRLEIASILGSNPEVDTIRFLDDLFLGNSADFQQAIHLFKHFSGLKWRAMLHVLSGKTNLDQFRALKQSGCTELFMGIESGSVKIRKQINKAGTPEDILLVATEILTQGIDLKGYFMLGLPEENQADCQESLDLIEKLHLTSQATPGRFRPSVFQFRPYLGTPLYQKIINNQGIAPIKPCQIENSSRPQFDFSSGNFSLMTDEYLHSAIASARKYAS